MTFTVDASGGTGPIRFQWQRNGVNIAGATSAELHADQPDDGRQRRPIPRVVSDEATSVNSQAATLTVTSNQPPAPQILTPAVGSTYGGGQTISYSGSATDPESGALGASAFTWSVVFHHNTHTHDLVLPTTGSTTGSFTVPIDNETASDVFYRVHLTVRDPQGATTTVTRDIVPRLSQVTVTTNPANLLFTLDGTQHVGIDHVHRRRGDQSHVGSGLAADVRRDDVRVRRVVRRRLGQPCHLDTGNDTTTRFRTPRRDHPNDHLLDHDHLDASHAPTVAPTPSASSVRQRRI